MERQFGGTGVLGREQGTACGMKHSRCVLLSAVDGEMETTYLALLRFGPLVFMSLGFFLCIIKQVFLGNRSVEKETQNRNFHVCFRPHLMENASSYEICHKTTDFFAHVTPSDSTSMHHSQVLFQNTSVLEVCSRPKWSCPQRIST